MRTLPVILLLGLAASTPVLAQAPAPTIAAPMATGESVRATTQGVSDAVNDKKLETGKPSPDEKKDDGKHGDEKKSDK